MTLDRAQGNRVKPFSPSDDAREKVIIPCGDGCEPKLWDQAAAFDDASGWLRLAGADGLSASAAQ